MSDQPLSDIESPIIARALAYPFDAPGGSFIFAHGKALPVIKVDPQNFAATTVRIDQRSVPLADALGPLAGQLRPFTQWKPVLASGSNKSLRRLNEKFGHRLDHTVIPTLAVKVKDVAIVYGALLAPYGSIPATVMPLPGATAHTYVNLLDEETYDLLHDSEDVGEAYDVTRLPHASVTIDFEAQEIALSSVEAYVARAGYLTLDGTNPVLLPGINQGRSELDRLDQRQLLQRVMQTLGFRERLEAFVLQLIEGSRERAAILKRLERNHARPIHF